MDFPSESLVDFSVVSLARGAGMPQFRPHQVGDVKIIGVNHGEPIAVHVRNTSDRLIGVRIIVNGINVSSGERATHDPKDPMVFLRPLGREVAEKWPLSYNDGSPFIFREDATDPVKPFDHDDITAPNTICAMVFTEGSPQHAPQRTVATSGARLPGGGVVRNKRGSAARRRTAQRLVSPRFHELIQYGYSWSDSLMQALGEDKSSFNRFL